MALTKEKKKEIINQFQVQSKDSGSSEVQVALLTNKIKELTAHLGKNPKDYQTQRGLLVSVGRRKRLLNYLKNKSADSFRRIVDQLEIRA